MRVGPVRPPMAAAPDPLLMAGRAGHRAMTRGEGGPTGPLPPGVCPEQRYGR